MTDFTTISDKYEKDSIVQKSASEILLDLVDIKNGEDVLDLGCGTGHLTSLIKGKTRGKVIGADPSPGMIRQAETRFEAEDISFRRLAADKLDYHSEFDVIFCNSAFQWFLEPESILKKCFRALKPQGRMAIQAPAKQAYCPNFIAAITAVRNNPELGRIFAGFQSPWFFLETAQDYQALFEQAGFLVARSVIDEVVTEHSAEEVFKIFESGAAAGYLNEQYYPDSLTETYFEQFRKTVRESFQGQADQKGVVKLVFYRIYLLAMRSKKI